MGKGKKLKFEEALKRLEEIVSLMEDEKLALDEALARYEEGVKLAKFCARSLNEAEKRIEILSKKDDGTVEKEPFPPEESKGAAARTAGAGREERRGKAVTEEELLL